MIECLSAQAGREYLILGFGEVVFLSVADRIGSVDLIRCCTPQHHLW